MTTYREEWRNLCRAIDSILAQTLTNIEFIIVFERDDANFDRVKAAYSDPRLVVVKLTEGRGRNACHNMALSLARGRYIARMDGDDFAYPERLERQVEYLRLHPEIAVLGTAGRLVDRDGNVLGIRRFPLDHDGIVRSMALTNPIFHSSVMWDRERVGYDLRYRLFHVDDFELWLRVLSQGRRFANLPDVLIDYRQPQDYRRPMKTWRGNLWVRLLHWRLCARYPLMAVGIATFAVLACMPQGLVNRLTERNRLSDYLRSIRRAGTRGI
jgi:glycosyltransferase involved in cell wall biosynthesis